MSGRWLGTVMLVMMVAAASALWWRGRGAIVERAGPPAGRRPAASDPRSPPPSFGKPQISTIRLTDVTPESGVDFTYYGSPSPQRYMTEQNGGGVAIADFDRDEIPDIFLVNGSSFEEPAQRAGATQELFLGTGGMHYRSVTRHAGLVAYGFGMGCVAADYNNDGFPDLLVTGYKGNRMWQNQGDGTFREVPFYQESMPHEWSTSAAFADLNGDGNLDLYVVNYVEWSPAVPPCFASGSRPRLLISCSPGGRKAQNDRLYRNAGDGTFEDVSRSSGIDAVAGKGLGVSIADFDGDGRLDIYVANDTSDNILWRNLGDLHFENVAVLWGAAVQSDGRSPAGMGIACADYNHDGTFDLFVTNFAEEPNSLYDNLRTEGFVARNAERGIDAVSKPLLGFGTVFADFDGDTWPDLFVANGHVWDRTSLGLGDDYTMPQQVLRNEQGKRFSDVSAPAGRFFRERRLGRGLATGDLDGDGDPDLVLTCLMSPVTVLRNDSASRGMRMSIRFEGIQAARQPLGARVEWESGGARFTSRVLAGDGFQSSSEDRLLISSARQEPIDRVRITWPDGVVETWEGLSAHVQITLREGTGVRSQNAAHERPGRRDPDRRRGDL